MNFKLNYSTAKKIFPLCFLILLANLAVLSQTTPKAFSMDSSGVRWKIDVGFKTIKSIHLVSVVLLDKTTGTTVKITDYVLLKNPTIAGEINGIAIPSIALAAGTDRYQFIITILEKQDDESLKRNAFLTPDIKFEDLSSDATKLEMESSNTTVKNVFRTKPAESKAKKDSDIYISGEFGGARGEKAAFSTEIKIAPSFGSTRWQYTPIFFNLNASTSPEADPDNLEIGAQAIYIHPFDLKPTKKWKFRVTGLDVPFGGKIEAEKDFENANLVFDGRLTFVTTSIPLGKTSTLTIQPFIGTELGKNLKSPLPAARGDSIARAFAGTDLLLDIPIKNSGLQGIVWDTSYIRRWLFSNELGYETDDNDELVLTKFGKSPRDYFQSKVEFTINKFLNPYVSYEWGEMPPSYKLVDHRFRVGFVYKFKLVPR